MLGSLVLMLQLRFLAKHSFVRCASTLLGFSLSRMRVTDTLDPSLTSSMCVSFLPMASMKVVKEP